MQRHALVKPSAQTLPHALPLCHAAQPGIMYAWDERLYQYTPATAPLLYTLGTCGTTPTRPSTPAPSTLTKRVLNNDVVDIVFENLSPFMHPMHLHGYQFTVLGSKYLVPSGYEYSPQTVCPNGKEG